MKKFTLLLLFAGTLFSQMPLAQNISCADFSITGITPDLSVNGGYLISIQFNGSTDTYVNYPYISALLDSNGDTIASGGIYYFAQLGNTTQDYPVAGVADLTGSAFSAVFIYGIDLEADTCLLSFGSPTSVTGLNIASPAVSLWPNPANNQVHISVDDLETGTNYMVRNSLGQVVLSGNMNTENTTVDLSHLTGGVYLFSIGANMKQTFKVLKE